MKIYKKVLIIIAIIISCLLLYFMVKTFAKYATSVQQTTDISIARWNIKVNNTSIQSNEPVSFTIEPIFPGNDHIASGIIAPTSEGYFTLDFDFTDVDVSFEYNVEVSPNNDSSVSDLVVTGYSVDDNDIIEFDENKGIKNTIYLSSGIKHQAMTIFIAWDDSNTANMNNIEDTYATLQSSNNALLDVKIKFTQTTH